MIVVGVFIATTPTAEHPLSLFYTIRKREHGTFVPYHGGCHNALCEGYVDSVVFTRNEVFADEVTHEAILQRQRADTLRVNRVSAFPCFHFSAFFIN